MNWPRLALESMSVIMNPEDLLLAVLAIEAGGDRSKGLLWGEVSPETEAANFCCWSTSVVMLVTAKL